MKKILIPILACILCLSLFACSKGGDAQETSAADGTSASEVTTAGGSGREPVMRLNMPQEEYIARFKDTVENEGFEVVSGDGNVRFGGYEDTYWNITGDVGSAQVNDGETLYMYVYDGGEWTLDMEKPLTDVTNPGYLYLLENQIIAMLFRGDYKDMEVVEENVTRCGITCRMCREEISYMGETRQCTICIDGEHGFCLEITAEDGAQIFKADELLFGDNVEVPELESGDPVWKPNKFTESLPKPEFGILTSAELSEDGESFHVFVNVANEANVNAYIQTLLDYGYVGEKTLENDGMDIRFRGQNDNCGFTVEVFYTNGIVNIDAANMTE